MKPLKPPKPQTPLTPMPPIETTHRLVLNRPHTHAGKTHGAGESIVVDAPTAYWLVAQGVAAFTPQATPARTPLDSERPTTPQKDPQP